MSGFGHGLLIGKFYPPHAGHHAVIRRAASECDEVTVLAMASAAETIALDDRIAWLRDEHADDSGVHVTGIRCDAPLDVTDERVWIAQVAAMRAGLAVARRDAPVDAVYCGDSYGDELAKRFGARAVQIARSQLSGTDIRRDLTGRWSDLAPATRAGLTTRVVVLGAESTGTTTVAQRLADHYARREPGTRCVAEFGREYTAREVASLHDSDVNDIVWRPDDFDIIAAEQTRREEAAARSGSTVLICDTDAFATSIWERRYLGATARTGQPWTAVPPRAVYLVTDHEEVPWADDGMREGDLAVRAAMTGWFTDALTAAGHSWVLLTGSLEDRVDLAVRTIDPLLRLAATFGEPAHGPGFEA